MAKRKTVGRTQVHITKGLMVGSRIRCTDNSGARIVQIIAVKHYKGRLNRIPRASVADMVIVSVKQGSPQRRKQIFPAIVVRQKLAYRRRSGDWIQFEENAVVLTNEVGDPLGSEIRGPVAKEAAEKWPRIAHQASIIV
ncbi:MAG: 50S ribosomal protein L14 [Candidatus Heimdallarchaeota archaeon]|nr:50S ribosomal protein L14 [Candidatus Heimdallarchaeota archaeon]MCK4955571.1 50S ribosomal protein L14 [Candidatus Heimdallarchaeota archaeon]